MYMMDQFCMFIYHTTLFLKSDFPHFHVRVIRRACCVGPARLCKCCTVVEASVCSCSRARLLWGKHGCGKAPYYCAPDDVPHSSSVYCGNYCQRPASRCFLQNAFFPEDLRIKFISVNQTLPLRFCETFQFKYQRRVVVRSFGNRCLKFSI